MYCHTKVEVKRQKQKYKGESNLTAPTSGRGDKKMLKNLHRIYIDPFWQSRGLRLNVNNPGPTAPGLH